MEETKQIANSNSRAIQAMMEQQVTDRLKREEEKREHEQRMARLEDIVSSLARIETAQTNMLTNFDKPHPVIFQTASSFRQCPA